MEEKIKIYGARTHNLKNINLEIPKNKLIVITGISGSGKSSLAFDTIYAEGQRRFIESLSGYARQFLEVLPKPDVDKIEGLGPAIAIEQGLGIKNPRSTVGTQTEIYDYLRILFARLGKPFCPKCKNLLSNQTIDDIFNSIQAFNNCEKIFIYAPVVYGKKGEFKNVIEEIVKAGFLHLKIDGVVYPIEEAQNLFLSRNKIHHIYVLVDKFVASKKVFVEDRARILDSLSLASRVAKNFIIIEVVSKKKSQEFFYSEELACRRCGINFPKIEPRLFSFNSPYGACPLCLGIGRRMVFDPNSIVPNPELSILEGAIKPWFMASHRVGRQGYYYLILDDLASKLGFSLKEPFKDLAKEVREIILFGSEKYEFEGVVPNLERRWHEGSEATKLELSQYIDFKICEKCKGKRLKDEALSVYLDKMNIWDVGELYIDEALSFFNNLRQKHYFKTKYEIEVSRILLQEIIERLEFLFKVGLSYLSLNREVETLSGGEAQRVRLATQIGSGLSGVIYVLDEPSAGLHPRDNNMLLEALRKLRDLKNTVIVVEHDRFLMENADYLLDLGPGSGKSGGEIIFSGRLAEMKSKSNSLTANYLRNELKVEPEKHKRRFLAKGYLEIIGAEENNLKKINVKIPLGLFVGVSGVSGSGKSSLVNDIVGNYLLKHFYGAKVKIGKFKAIYGVELIDKVIIVDQSPIGRTPRSNPATYTGVFDHIRRLFSSVRESKIRGYTQSKFSFNTKEGRCQNCRGEGFLKVEMHFLAPLYVECEVCKGTRYKQEVLDVLYDGKSIADVLKMEIKEAFEFFKDFEAIKRRLKTLMDIGLDYISLGQAATTLSGGEAQRIKLAKELNKISTGSTLYIMDEPTTGLHFDDIKKLLVVINKLVDLGNTVLVIEHNLDVLKACDYIIDLGPDGGKNGGYIVAEGTPEELAKNKKSYTGQYLAKIIKSV